MSQLAQFFTLIDVLKMQAWDKWMYSKGVQRVQSSWSLKLRYFYMLENQANSIDVFDAELQNFSSLPLSTEVRCI